MIVISDYFCLLTHFINKQKERIQSVFTPTRCIFTFAPITKQQPGEKVLIFSHSPSHFFWSTFVNNQTNDGKDINSCVFSDLIIVVRYVVTKNGFYNRAKLHRWVISWMMKWIQYIALLESNENSCISQSSQIDDCILYICWTCKNKTNSWHYHFMY